MLPRFKLIKKQKELLKKLDSVISELNDAGVELAVDTDNRELLAFALTKDQSSRFETDCECCPEFDEKDYENVTKELNGRMEGVPFCVYWVDNETRLLLERKQK